MLIEMGLMKFLEGIRKRLMLTNRELGNISGGGVEIQDKLAKDLQTLTNMMYLDFFLIEGYTDQQYRDLFQSIVDNIKDNEIIAPAQFAHLKRYNDFCRAMFKNLRKYLKENLGQLIEEPQEEPAF